MSILLLRSVGLLNELYQEQVRARLREAWPLLTEAERAEIAHRVAVAGLAIPERRWQYRSGVALAPMVIGSTEPNDRE